MTDVEKQAKKEYQKNYCNKFKTYKDKLLLEIAKRGKKVANYCKKKRKKFNKSKIKIKKIYKQFKWLLILFLPSIK